MQEVDLLHLRSATSRDEREGITRWPALICCLGALALALIDWQTARLNPSIPYIAILVTAMIWGSRSATFSPWRAAGALIVLTYAGYLFGENRRAAAGNVGALLASHRLINRTFCALALAGVAAAFDAWRTGASLARHSNRVLFACMVLAILCADLMAPAQYNFPILYLALLVVSIRARSRRVIWTLLPFFALLTMAGYVCGAPATDADALRPLINRGVVV